MKNISLILALLFSWGTAGTLVASEATTCCYSNPRYSGQCEVTPGADEKCAEILTYRILGVMPEKVK